MVVCYYYVTVYLVMELTHERQSQVETIHSSVKSKIIQVHKNKGDQ